MKAQVGKVSALPKRFARVPGCPFKAANSFKVIGKCAVYRRPQLPSCPGGRAVGRLLPILGFAEFHFPGLAAGTSLKVGACEPCCSFSSRERGAGVGCSRLLSAGPSSGCGAGTSASKSRSHSSLGFRVLMRLGFRIRLD